MLDIVYDHGADLVLTDLEDLLRDSNNQNYFKNNVQIISGDISKK
ncbi:MAG: hypothetical protein CM15mP129_05760 [Chloroflexota bacterium]|nr:MAG: hypothetical protein CM15mP129_05760 [Chloroflexota bacterium]